jgi:hypothetical protein
MANSKPALSFAQIVQGRDASVRVIEDGLADLVDVVMVVTGKDCNHSNACLRSLDNSLFDNQKVVMHNGRKYVTLKDAITLIMVLPGKMAKELRSQFADIIHDYIKKNFEPEFDNQGSLCGFKRRREELELLKLEEDIKTSAQARLKGEEEIKTMALTRVIHAAAEIERVRDPTKSNLDERTRLMVQDAMQNSILNNMAVTTNQVSENAPISISSVAKELGFNANKEDVQRIGRDLGKRYRQKHGQPPSKHDQLCGGRVTSVNSYTEKDRPLVAEAVQAYFASDPEDDETHD